MIETALALAMIAAAILVIGGVRLIAVREPGGGRKQGWLMLAAAAVLLANVLIWTV